MDFEEIERELRDVWAEIAILQAGMAFPAVDFLSLKEEFEELKSKIDCNQIHNFLTEFQSLNLPPSMADDFLRISKDVDNLMISAQRIQGVEESLQHLSQEFKLFRDIVMLRLNNMSIDVLNNERRVVNNEGILLMYIDNFHRFVTSAFERLHLLELDGANLRHRVEACQLLNAIPEETLIVQGI